MALKPHRLTSKPPRPRKGGRRGITLSTLRRFTRECWRVFCAVMRAVIASPPIARAVVISALLLLWLGVNWVYHAFHKPTEILFPLGYSLNKRSAETWKQYESPFREHATAVITPKLLAALA